MEVLDLSLYQAIHQKLEDDSVYSEAKCLVSAYSTKFTISISVSLFFSFFWIMIRTSHGRYSSIFKFLQNLNANDRTSRI